MQSRLPCGGCTIAAIVAISASLPLLEAAKAASSRSSARSYAASARSVPMSLEHLETALLALEKQRGTPELAGTVTEIDKMVTEMKGMVRNQSKLTQQTINQAWSDFISCAGLYDIDSRSDLQSVDSIARVHANCRLEESGKKMILDACEKELAVRSASELQRKGEFDTLNQFPSSGFCAHHTNSQQYSTVRGYIKHYRDHFASHLLSWENAFNASTDATKAKLHTLRDCYGDDRTKNGQGGKEEALVTKKVDCQKLQRKVEDAACDRIAHRADCVSYAKCYESNHNAYFASGQTKETSIQQSGKQREEYRALVRIKCVLDAYATYQDGPSLSKSISDCQQVQADVSFLDISLPDEADAMPPDNTACLQHSSSEKPGVFAASQACTHCRPC
ncbi:unnamed protein product [Effrenium voratum]|nr:unnamed protein product [Effrenium voratum]